MGQQQSTTSSGSTQQLPPHQSHRLVDKLLREPPMVRGQLSPIVPESDQRNSDECTTIEVPIVPATRY